MLERGLEQVNSSRGDEETARLLQRLGRKVGGGSEEQSVTAAVR